MSPTECSLGMASGTWDTHVHVLDPENYSESRTYTPPAATARSLLDAGPANNFLLVEATVERDETHLLDQLAQLQSANATRVFRAAILHDINTSLSERRMVELHDAGVRCLRIHNMFKSDSSNTTETIVKFLHGSTLALISKYRWAVSLRLSLKTWSELKPSLERISISVPVIAEHCGGVTLPLPDDDRQAFEDFLDLLRRNIIYVKLGALHRRVRGGRSVHEFLPVIQRLAEAGPQQLLWGSDWPHVDPESKGLSQSQFLQVDEKTELELIRQAMPGHCFETMLKVTPAKLFG